ncbi:E3 ubiquitin-protein ligase rad18 [Podila epigama]|nr:E3 ubiquitin-protein ligase rad18 [Podila epigama]
MDFDIPDPSDWPKEFGSLGEIDSHLRCPICKEYFRAAMMLQCYHNFCSECIRRHLDKESNCPACRVNTSTSQLRRNVTLDEIANNFGDCSHLQETTDEGDDDQDGDFSPTVEAVTGNKGKYTTRSSGGRSLRSRTGHTDPATSTSQTSSQSTSASQNNSQPSQQLSQESPTEPIEPPVPSPSAAPYVKHSLVACPVCMMAIPEAQTNSHLDKYCFMGKKDPLYNIPLTLIVTQSPHVITAYERDGNSKISSLPASPQRNGTLVAAFTSSPVKFGGFGQQQQPQHSSNTSASPIPEQKRLPKLTYSVLTDKQLRKKLQEIGIPSHGDKHLMQKRHAEYLTLYNANCDSTRPQSNAQLLKTLDNWERAYIRDQNAKEAQRRAQEEQQQKYVQEMALQRQEDEASAAGNTDSNSQPSSQTSNSGNTGFVPNQANNNAVNVALASQTAQAHTTKFEKEYASLVADIRRRQMAEKAAKAAAAASEAHSSIKPQEEV